MDFNPVHHPILFQLPRLISTVSAWVEHIPFAYLMVELCRPRVLVELGTHQGDSYIAFCQAVAELKTETKCFAVDTWAGDSQAGFYSDQVLQGLRGHHDPHFSAFSKLMQMSFDAAAPSFTDGQIDILHIDGLHTYEAVRHDFDTWRPKVSDRGVVIFHDTAHRRRADFGVYRLWDELTPQYPNFEFKNAEGLGILLLGANVPQPFKEFIEFANANTDNVRSLFHTLGERIRGVQVILRCTQPMLVEYQALGQWRQRTGQEQLRPVTMEEVVQNPAILSQFLSSEVQRILQPAPERK